jgi:acyl-coenzyme A thioesterase PaaI-like protein
MTRLGDAVDPSAVATAPTADGPPTAATGPSAGILSETGSFINELSFDFGVEGDGSHGTGRASITPMMRSSGSLPRPSVLLTIADCVAGVPAMHVSSPNLAVTLDMVVRIVADGADPELDVTSDVLKRGRNIVASEVRFTNAGTDELVALCYLTFMASPRPQDVSPPIPEGMAFRGSLPVDFAQRVGLRTVAPGVTEVDRRRFVVQASNSLQGGIVALLGETAAESLAGMPVVELDTRFFAGVRVGPGRATAVMIGDGLVRAEVRDVGNDDRLAALVVARVAEGPGGRPSPPGR